MSDKIISGFISQSAKNFLRLEKWENCSIIIQETFFHYYTESLCLSKTLYLFTILFKTV